MGILKVATRSKHLLAATFAIAWIGAAVPVAGAQEPGVVYEPGSPSDKEYAIPLEEARRDAGGDRGGSDQSVAFGTGISRRGGGGGPGSRSGDASGATRRPGASAQSPSGGGSRADSHGLRERLAGAETADAPFLWTLAPYLLVLLPGLLLGLVLARRAGQQPPAPA